MVAKLVGAVLVVVLGLGFLAFAGWLVTLPTLPTLGVLFGAAAACGLVRSFSV